MSTWSPSLLTCLTSLLPVKLHFSLLTFCIFRNNRHLNLSFVTSFSVPHPLSFLSSLTRFVLVIFFLSGSSHSSTLLFQQFAPLACVEDKDNKSTVTNERLSHVNFYLCAVCWEVKVWTFLLSRQRLGWRGEETRGSIQSLLWPLSVELFFTPVN